MVRRKIDVNGLANSMLSNLVVTFYEIEDEDKDGDEDEYEGENEEEGEREEESEEANGEEENRCKRFAKFDFVVRFVVREALFTAPWTPSGRLGGAIRNFGPPEGPPGPCTQAFCCSGGPVHHPLDSIWAPRGCDQEFRASRGPPWAVHPIQKGPPGRPSARREVVPEGLGAIFELLKNVGFYAILSPRIAPVASRGPKKEQKWKTRTHLAGRRPG